MATYIKTLTDSEGIVAPRTLAEAVSLSDGRNVESAINGSGTLLWTNPSTTQSVGETTITLDLSQYKKVEIECIEGTALQSNKVIKTYNIGDVGAFFGFIRINSGGANIRARNVTINTNSVVFGAGGVVNISSSSISYSQSNVWGIPSRIWGIK